MQKAGIVDMIKRRTDDLTLAIGDGESDIFSVQSALFELACKSKLVIPVRWYSSVTQNTSCFIFSACKLYELVHDS